MCVCVCVCVCVLRASARVCMSRFGTGNIWLCWCVQLSIPHLQKQSNIISTFAGDWCRDRMVWCDCDLLTGVEIGWCGVIVVY